MSNSYTPSFRIFHVLAFRFSFLALLVSVGIDPAAGTTPTSCPDVTVGTSSLKGSLQSSTDNKAACHYYNIQYANPNRWQDAIALANPQQGAATDTIRCPQLFGANAVGQEDCLYLDIWKPSTATSNSNLPVMVFIHGGGFTTGSGLDAIYRSPFLSANEGVVLVTFNYRLGALGFLTYGGDTNNPATVGNYGFRDQIIALNWIQAFVGEFGGNNKNITIFGESAGAMSVGLHSLPENKSFQTAIMQSNPLGFRYKTTTEAQEVGTTFVSKLPASDNLTEASIDDILKAQKSTSTIYATNKARIWTKLTWGPIVDDTTIKAQPLDNGLSLPTLLGTNKDEGTLFVYLNKLFSGLLAFGYQETLKRSFGPDNADKVWKLYPAPKWPGFAKRKGAQFAKIMGDYLFTCANLHVLKKTSNNSSYLYQFDYLPTNELWAAITQCSRKTDDPYANKICHTAELPFVFHTESYNGRTLLVGTKEKSLSTSIAAYWAAFAKNQSPTVGSAVAWPAYSTAGTTNYLALGSTSGSSSSTKISARSYDAVATAANCNFWENTIGYDHTGSGQ